MGSPNSGKGASVPFILALGSNVGDRGAHLDSALRFLGRHLTIESVSRTIESEPWGPEPQGPFLNLVLRGRGVTDPLSLLEIARAAEGAAGRVRETRFGPRTLDVDLIFFGDLVLALPELVLPHPRWAERPFVRNLLPEVAGGMVDPLSGQPLAELGALESGGGS